MPKSKTINQLKAIQALKAGSDALPYLIYTYSLAVEGDNKAVIRWLGDDINNRLQVLAEQFYAVSEMVGSAE